MILDLSHLSHLMRLLNAMESRRYPVPRRGFRLSRNDARTNHDAIPFDPAKSS